MADGVLGWDLFSTLVQQSEYVTYYKSIPPVACPFDGEPLRQGPSAHSGVWFCPWGNFQYPRDYNPETHAGM